MASPILPSNSFITRLLQQTSQNNTQINQLADSKEAVTIKPDQTNFSDEARQANKDDTRPQLESKLIELYNQKGQGSS